MLRYFLKRILLFLPTLFVVSLIIFFLSKQSENDLIQNKLESNNKTTQFTPLLQWEKVRKERERLGFNKAVFYWSVYRQSTSDTLDRIADEKIRQQLNTLSYSIGNWERVNHIWKEIKTALNHLDLSQQQAVIQYLHNGFRLDEQTSVYPPVVNIHQQITDLKEQYQGNSNYKLHLKWNGKTNQYHQWISALLSGDFGQSYVDGQSVNEKLYRSLKWTLLLSVFSILLTFAIAIPVAFYTSFRPQKRLSKCIDQLFFAWYSIPNFWVATLLIVFFSSGDYFNWFPAYGLGYVDGDTSFMELLSIRTAHLVLPLLTLTYGSIAFIYQQLKQTIQKELQQDYILTAKAKGLSLKNIKWKQLFKNVSFPLITILGGLVPSLLSGSFIVESIFSIPGMGKISLEAFLSRDFALVYAVLMISAFFGMLGLLLADLLYYKADPRVQLHSNPLSES